MTALSLNIVRYPIAMKSESGRQPLSFLARQKPPVSFRQKTSSKASNISTFLNIAQLRADFSLISNEQSQWWCWCAQRRRWKWLRK